MAFTCFWGSSYTIVLIRIAVLHPYFKAHLAPPFFKIFVSPPLYSIPPTFNTLARKVNIFIFGSFATDKWQIYPFEKNIIIHLKRTSLSIWKKHHLFDIQDQEQIYLLSLVKLQIYLKLTNITLIFEEKKCIMCPGSNCVLNLVKDTGKLVPAEGVQVFQDSSPHPHATPLLP